MITTFDKIFNNEKKILKQCEALVNKIDSLKEEYKSYTDCDLQSKTAWFRDRLAKGETLDDILPEAYATVRETAGRVKGESPYAVQLIGGIVLHNGDIAEMKTGEGKTLTATLPVYLNALEGKGVHVITANEYLAKRDAELNGAIYRFLGLSVGVNKKGMPRAAKRAVYNMDITYTTASELGFDYLRDNMVKRLSDKVLRGLNFALIDECDSILIDEARTPLIISGKPLKTTCLYQKADDMVRRLTPEVDYIIDVKEHTVSLTEIGIAKIEETWHISNLYSPKNADAVHFLIQALRAHTLFTRDIDYVIEDGEVLIVDQFTGRTMPGRQFSEGLHQAIAAKEDLAIKSENRTVATISFQNFFRLYDKIAGMTGTAKPEEEEFLKVYNMRTIQIPTNKPVIRIDDEDALFWTKAEKYTALIKEVIIRHKVGQPILIGTVDIETSELLSHMLNKANIKHEVLNAKNHAKEAEIIAKAGRCGAVTVATNMAGRGTDIKLDPDVRDLGGLAVLASERHESRRIDDQLRGRAGRQGDPGYSRFYVSMEDEMIERYIPKTAGTKKLSAKNIKTAQETIESINFDQRERMLAYDEVSRLQRDVVYKERDRILSEDPHHFIHELFDRCLVALYERSLDRGGSLSLPKFKCELALIGVKMKTDKWHEGDLKCLKDCIWQAYEAKTNIIKRQLPVIERQIILSFLDNAWMEHIDTMEHLKRGISLRSYAQNDPLEVYNKEAFDLFSQMMSDIAIKVTRTMQLLEVKHKQSSSSKQPEDTR